MALRAPGLSLSMAAVEIEVGGNAMNVRTAAVAGGRRSPPARSIYQAVLVALCLSLSLSIENEELSPSHSLAFQSHFGVGAEAK